MRTRFIAVLCFALFFALLFAPGGTLLAQDNAPAVQASDLASSPAIDGQPVPPFIPPPSGGTAPVLPEPAPVISVTTGIDRPLVAPASLPPVIVGHNGGQTIMIASSTAGDPVSVIKFTPGFADPSQPAQQVETIIDLGFGLNGRITWDAASSLATFAFLP